MSYPVVDYASTLPEADREILFRSISLLIAMVVGADFEFDLDEMTETVEVLAASTEALGPEFRWSPEAQVEFDQLSATAREAGPSYYAQRLAELGRVVRAMPSDVRDTYLGFVREMCLRLAEASGRFLWFGEAINEDEKIALRKIAAALGLSFGDLGSRRLSPRSGPPAAGPAPGRPWPRPGPAPVRSGRGCPLLRGCRRGRPLPHRPWGGRNEAP